MGATFADTVRKGKWVEGDVDVLGFINFKRKKGKNSLKIGNDDLEGSRFGSGHHPLQGEK